MKQCKLDSLFELTVKNQKNMLGKHFQIIALVCTHEYGNIDHTLVIISFGSVEDRGLFIHSELLNLKERQQLCIFLQINDTDHMLLVDKSM